MPRLLFLGVLLGALSPAALAAGELKPLSEVDEIYMPLRKAAVARLVEVNCPEIAQREWRVKFEGWKLYHKARRMGYSRDEIEGFVKSKEEQARALDWANAELDTLEVLPEDQASICEYGEGEIETKSFIGSLLKKTP